MDKASYLLGMNKLWANFPSRASSEADKVMALQTYWDELGEREWITNAVWERATRLMLRSQHEWFPTIRQVTTWCVEADRELDREEQRQADGPPEADLTHVIAGTVEVETLQEANTLRSAVAKGIWDRSWAAADAKRIHGRTPSTDEIDAEVRRLFAEDASSDTRVLRREGRKMVWVKGRKVRGEIEASLAYRMEWE
jgi:hypothetical protein